VIHGYKLAPESWKDPMSRQILNGWKEISSYTKRSVRTVQRWEARLGLPVYRPALKDRSAVVAFSDELDRWISRASPGADEEDTVLNGYERNDAGLSRLLDNMDTMVLGGAEHSSKIRLLLEELRQSLKSYHYGLASRTPVPTASVPSRGMGPVLTFRQPQRSLTPEQVIFGEDVPAMADQSDRAPGHSAVEKAR
jgi:hypothetical protein